VQRLILLKLIYLLNLGYRFGSLVLSLPSDAKSVFVNRNVLTLKVIFLLSKICYAVLVKFPVIQSKNA